MIVFSLRVFMTCSFLTLANEAAKQFCAGWCCTRGDTAMTHCTAKQKGMGCVFFPPGLWGLVHSSKVLVLQGNENELCETYVKEDFQRQI